MRSTNSSEGLVQSHWGALPYQQLALLGAFTFISGLIDLPLSAWSCFRIEQSTASNRMSWSMWLGDLVKQTLVGIDSGSAHCRAFILWLMGAASFNNGGCGPGTG